MLEKYLPNLGIGAGITSAYEISTYIKEGSFIANDSVLYTVIADLGILFFSSTALWILGKALNSSEKDISSNTQLNYSTLEDEIKS